MTTRQLLLCMTCLTAGSPGAARAQAEAPGTIVVTAVAAGDTAALGTTPGNAQVISGEALTRQDPENLADLLNANVAGVTISNGSGSPYQSDVTYRGFQATSLLGAPTGLSVWLDGVRMNEPFGAIVNWDLIPLNAVRAVEVLPGSNPLFGLNTLGGSLVLDTRDGARDGGLGLTAQAGSFNRRAVAAQAGGTFGGKAFDWFVAGNLDRQDGYRWHTRTDVAQGYGKLRWHGGGAHAELDVIWAQSTLNGTQSLPLSMLGTPQMAYTWPDNVANRQLIVNLKAGAHLAPRLTIGGNVYYRRSNAHSVNSNAADDDNCGDTRDCTASAPGGTARDLLTASGYTGALPLHDYTGNINTTLVYSDVHQRIFGGNALIDDDAPLLGLSNDFNLGGSFETARIGYGQTTDLAYLVAYQTVPMPWNVLYGSAAGFRGSPLLNAVNVAARNSSYSLFLRDMLRLTRTLTLSGALSYTHSQVRLDGTNATYLNGDGGYTWTGNDGQAYYNPAYIGAQYWDGAALATASAPAGAIAGPEVAPVTGAHAYHRIDPTIGLTWDPLRAVGLFASYSEAMRAPTAIELACADPATPCALPTGFNGDPDLRAVVAQTVEAGGRGRIGRHLRWNAAVYRTRLSNDIQFIYTPAGLGYFANVGATRRIGLEAGLNADFTRWHLSAGYGHVRATYRAAFTDASGDTVQPGARIPGIPAGSLKLRAVWTPARTVALGATLIATSGQYAHGDEANQDAMVPGYTVVDVDAHITPTARTELFAKVSNLFDRAYATYGVMGTNIYTGGNEQFRTPAPGRAFVVGLRYGFGGATGGGIDAD